MSTTATPTKKAFKLGSVQFPVRFSYLKAFVAEERKDDDGNTKKLYSVQIHLSKKDKAGYDAFMKRVEEEIDKKWKKRPPSLKLPLRDGDAEWDTKNEEKPEPALKGNWFFNASTTQRPQVVGPRRNEATGKFDLLGPDDIKSGDYGVVSITFFTFEGKQKGVGIGLSNIQKLRDGDPLGSRTTADNDFDDEEVDGELTGSVL